MKKASASLVVLSVIFLITALLIYLFEYVSIERMMYLNRTRMKQFYYNCESVENVIVKDIEGTYQNGGEIYDLKSKDYSLYENQKVVLATYDVANKIAFKIFCSEKLSNNKEKIKETYYTLMNKIFFKEQLRDYEKEKFYNNILENNVQEFKVEEINNYFSDIEHEEDRTFNFSKAIVKISQDELNNDINANIDGSGILIIDGNINVRGSIHFNGLIIINGTLSVEENKDIFGYVLDMEGKSNISYLKSLKTVYTECKEYKGIIRISKSS